MADIVTMPSSVITMFQQGAFVINISGRPWHSVAVDEAHEMLVNKDCKTSIVRPSPDYINRVAQYIPYRAKCIQNMKLQLFPDMDRKADEIQSAFSCKPADRKYKLNEQAQMQRIQTSGLFEISNDDSSRGLFNPFTKKVATSQQHDLANFAQ